MSEQYDEYLNTHRSNVKKGYNWIKRSLPELLMEQKGIDYEWQISCFHDDTKTIPDEYEAYDAYFYGEKKTKQVIDDFNNAWLVHIHRNPHHWQHWVLINDNPKEGIVALDMPYNYIIEMICDWWSFSWEGGEIFEIFNWYDRHKKHMKLSKNTRKTVECILEKMERKLEKTRKKTRYGEVI